MTNYSSECDCGDYCEWCHPEMCGLEMEETRVSQMTNDLYDKLIDYVEQQRSLIKVSLKTEPANKEYLKGRMTAFLDILSFLMTDGKLL